MKSIVLTENESYKDDVQISDKNLVFSYYGKCNGKWVRGGSYSISVDDLNVINKELGITK